MEKRNWKIYVVHHSHTDIGYTDLQERVIYNQVDYIRTAIRLAKEDPRFKWNCETWFCVEKFLEEATDAEKEDFFSAVRSGNIGISANYLNFTDLAEPTVLTERVAEMKKLFSDRSIRVESAMIADINGVSMGYRDALLASDTKFFYTNVHCHHGQYPLYRNQQPFFWENEKGQRLLVFSAEHYNLGNALGISPNKYVYWMTKTYFGPDQPTDAIDALEQNLDKYLAELAESGYPYSFLPISVSGVFSDNAPPNPVIPQVCAALTQRRPDIQMQMVTLDELYSLIRDEVADAPVYRGDFTDWWAHGIGSTPYSLKHYLEARRYYRLCDRLDPQGKEVRDRREAQDNLLLYAEHTWGHSATITDPAETMVVNLDIRKTSYASKAHEAAAKRLNRLTHGMGDILRYYDRQGTVKAVNPTALDAMFPVEFYVEAPFYYNAKVTDEEGNALPTQVSPHPRGARITFTDHFAPHEEKVFYYQELPEAKLPDTTRTAFRGSELVRDIVNDFDPETYTLPYYIENKFFRISYEIGKGITSFLRKSDGRELLKPGPAPFFTPVYERTEIRTDVYEERRLCGRNIRGIHAQRFYGALTGVEILNRGPVFTEAKLSYRLEGTFSCVLILKLYRDLPRLNFTLQVAKTLDKAVENLFLPMSLNLDAETWIDKGGKPMRPGVDQLPGTCMEYYVADNGLLYREENCDTVIQTKDTALLYMGELKHHPIRLCDGREENNRRDVWSWIMNNIWETNFKMDLSGITEYQYSLRLEPRGEGITALTEGEFDILTFITK